jgi:cell division protein FtsW (lipid II flippase)
MDVDHAQREAVRQMGDAKAVGIELDKLHRPCPQPGLVAAALLLAIFGCILRIVIPSTESYSQIIKQVIFFFAGAGCMFVCLFADYSILGRHPRIIYAAVIISASLLLFYRKPVCGVYYVGYISLLFPLAYGLWVYSMRGRRVSGLLLAIAGIVPPTAICGAVSTWRCLLMTGVCFIILLAAVWHKWFSISRTSGIIIISAVIIAAGIIILPSAIDEIIYRFDVLKNPDAYPIDGYQASILSKMLTGASLFAPSATYAGYTSLMPNSTTDYLVATMICKYGFAPFIFLSGIMLGTFAFLMSKAFAVQDSLGRFICLAAILTLGVQSIVALLGNLGILPTICACPFITGNMHTVFDMALLGLSASVFRQRNIIRPFKETYYFNL